MFFKTLTILDHLSNKNNEINMFQNDLQLLKQQLKNSNTQQLNEINPNNSNLQEILNDQIVLKDEEILELEKQNEILKIHHEKDLETINMLQNNIERLKHTIEE